ncbi:MAG: double-strand break repair protein AddB [Rhizobiaceae bacterium]|nr:double-strand break repair protein AddB [Rhizobiaceae bacterium]
MTGSRLFSIPPGVPFLHQLAQSLCNGELVEGFCHRDDDPLGLSRATIYVPTRRAARALRSEFVDLLNRKSAILPTIRPLGENDDDSGFLEEDQPALLDLLPPISGPGRLLELAQLIMVWKQNLPTNIADFHGDNRLIAPANPADAVWLARSLADLLEAMETEKRPWSALQELVADDYAHWWQLTLEFLKIATIFWPARLAELNSSDPAAHRNAVLHAETERLRKVPPAGPVIIAGSTGSIPATAELMKVVAGLDQGAIVLPGLDVALDARIWALVGGDELAQSVDPTRCAHPQYGLSVLLRRFSADRSDVHELGELSPPMRARNQLVSSALMPAEATALWAEDKTDADTIRDVFEGVELIEAASEREEALAVAAAMRLAAEPQGDDGAQASGSDPHRSQPRHIALVTPDRNLARRVASELQRFGIDANDSGGAFLALTPQGTLLQLLLQSAFGSERTLALVSMLKHPLMRFQRDAGTARKAGRIIERVALRDGVADANAAELSSLFERRLEERLLQERHAPYWLKRLSEADIALARDLAVDIEQAFKPLMERVPSASPDDGTPGQRPVSEWVHLTTSLLETVARDEIGSLSELWGDEAGEKLASLLGSIMENRSGFGCLPSEWANMVPALVAGEMVKPRGGGHPHIFIWGALEARLQQVDTLVLAGLNEGTWPGSLSSDPFLSRSMKTAIGLDPPERRIGLAAHDFQMGLGTQHVILSRSARSANAPTVASRWLQRLSAVIGKQETGRLRARGSRYLDWATMLDAGEETPLASRPAPKPPSSSQPKRYSFSEIRTLRRDPYAIYAKRVLKLDPPEALTSDPGPAEKGTLYHAILERFVTEQIDPASTDALAQLREIAAKAFEGADLPDHVTLVWRAHFDKVAGAFVDWERGRRSSITRTYTESRAKLELPQAGIILSGIADRIDLTQEGMAEILDYKTGASPSRKIAWTLLDPQLPLEAAALQAGAFEELGPMQPASLAYVRLKPDPVLKVDRIEGKVKGQEEDKSAADLAEESIQRLTDLVTAFSTGKIGFASQIIPDPAAKYGHDYDHLARVREWSTADTDEAEGAET